MTALLLIAANVGVTKTCDMYVSRLPVNVQALLGPPFQERRRVSLVDLVEEKEGAVSMVSARRALRESP